MPLSCPPYTLKREAGQLYFRFLTTYEPPAHGIHWAQEVLHALDHTVTAVILDFEHFDRIDSRIFTALIQIQRACTMRDIRELVLTNAGPRLLRGLDLLRLSALFQIERRADTTS